MATVTQGPTIRRPRLRSNSQPQPGNQTPNLHDAAWTAGDIPFSDSGAGHTDNYVDPASPDQLWHFQWNCLTFDVLSMIGEDIGPEIVPPYNLAGDVQFTIGAGCAPFDYGFGVTNGPPTAIAQARPTNASVGEPVTFDGSASFDDQQPANELTYEWDFNYDGVTFNVDATGQVVEFNYTAPGTYTAALRVTDAGSLSDIDTVTITVAAPPTATNTHTPTITDTPTVTNTPTASATPSHTPTATRTSTPTKKPTVTRTPTRTPTALATSTQTPIASATPSQTQTPTSVAGAPTCNGQTATIYVNAQNSRRWWPK